MRSVLIPRRAVLAVAAALLPLASSSAWAQAWPARNITFVVPFAAGSATDQLARALGQSVTEQLHQTVVVDNKAGASGMLAAQAVARAPADGYTVLISSNTTHAANEHLFKKLAYDPVKDFAPISGLGKGGLVMVVHPASPYKSVAELMAAARATPGKISFGSGSSSSRVAAELFQQMAGIDLLHVPYKSNPQALTDLMGGQIQMMVTDTSTGVPQVKAGKLRALGVSGKSRLPLLPEVPTLDEAGVKGYEMGYWFAAWAPAGTPPAVMARLNEAFAVALKSPAVKAFFETSGGEAFATTSEGLGKFQIDEARKWGRVIKAAGIEPE